MADRLRLGDGVRLGLLQSLERWDGKGDAHGLAGDDIALPARFTALATQVVIFDRLGGPDAALAMVRRRAGGWFRPPRWPSGRARRDRAAGPPWPRPTSGPRCWPEPRPGPPHPPGASSTRWPAPSPTWST